MLRILSACLLTAGGLNIAIAQDDTGAPQGYLQLRTVVEKIVESVDESGQSTTELVPVESAVPGDEVVYTVTFKNVGDQAADNILITNPIPAEMRYVEGSAFGPGTDIQYSADGGEFYAEPAAIQVRDDTGNERVASADEYTHIRWMLNGSLGAGAQGFARFRAVIR